MTQSLPTPRSLALILGLAAVTACSSSSAGGGAGQAPMPMAGPAAAPIASIRAPSPDPRVGLAPARDGQPAAEAIWNLRRLSTTPPSPAFKGVTNSDLAFTGKYAIQGNYNGFQIWDISNPASPTLVNAYLCPASQSDVSVYGNLLFVSGEGMGGRVDCGVQGVPQAVSDVRLRGIRIFDISDIRNPKYIDNVQTCRGSHTHTVLADPKDKANVYIYVSGSAGVRSSEELAGCSGMSPDEDPNSALFRIEVIKVPLADPTKAAIVSSPRIFENLAAPPEHGASAADEADNAKALAEARARGAFVIQFQGQTMPLPDRYVDPMLDSIVKARGGSGAPTGADSAALRAGIQEMINKRFGGGGDANQARRGPSQCHDITVYPAIGYAGGACAGYGLLLDISDPVHPRRVAAVADSNFSYWHSATFSNDGSKLLFSDEWGGGGQPKCRAGDPHEWGADAIFSRNGNSLEFQSYYKMTAVQTSLENCVAHNGSLLPIPGRDVMVQAWYQGGISVFDWTDAAHPTEIAFQDRGPIDANEMGNAGSWSVYWYNGLIVSSEIGRGLDIFELTPSPAMTQNEIEAAKSVRLSELNAQGQPQFVWPATYALARAYADQLERSGGLRPARLTAVRETLAAAERASSTERRTMLSALENDLRRDAGGSRDASKVQLLAATARDLAAKM